MAMFANKNRPVESKGRDEGLVSLPDPVDDNLYLASAAAAAVKDKESGAYDEFLFSENGITEMPFEESIDSHLKLVEARLKDQGRRLLLGRQDDLLEVKAAHAKVTSKLKVIQENLSSVRSKIEFQAQILSGQKPGKHGLTWPGSVTPIATVRSGLVRSFAPYFVFLGVGLADIAIIVLSFQAIRGIGGFEPYILALPAVGVQLVFPHFIGRRIGLILHGSKKNLANYLESGLLLAAWLLYIWAMTSLRMSYIASKAGNISNWYQLEPALWVVNVLMLIGLGGWLLLHESRSNPHEVIHMRLEVAELRLIKQRQRLAARLSDGESKIEKAQNSVAVADASFRDAAEASGSKLAIAAKHIYRRSLLNQFGSPDFTGAYVGSKKKGK